MNLNNIKYIILAAIIYIVLKYLSNQQIQNTDIYLLTLIIILSYLLLENVFKMFNKNNSSINNEQFCNTMCPINNIENMTNLSATNNSKHIIKSEHTIENKVPSSINKHSAHTAKVPKQEIHEVEKMEPEMENSLGETITELEESVENIGKKYENKVHTNEGIERSGSREKSGVLVNEMDYTDYNHLPLADTYDNDSFEYGYSFLPPEKWYPQPPFPPMCVTDKRCPVFPVNTIGTPIDVKEWNSSRRITPPDNINTNYVINKLNNGR